MPQADAPPPSSANVRGPKTWNVDVPRFVIAAASSTTQSHVRPVTSRKPAARSARKRWRAGGTRELGPSARRKAPLATNVPASIAKTTAGPKAATRSPETAGPKIAAAWREIEMSAFACWSRSRLVTSGTSAVEAGPKKAEAAPNRAAVAPNIHSSIAPVTSMPKVKTSTAARTASQATITTRRSSRSAQTPPTSVKPTRASENAAKHEPELGRGGIELLEHRERERDRDERVTDRRRGSGEPQQPEAALAERPEAVGEAR